MQGYFVLLSWMPVYFKTVCHHRHFNLYHSTLNCF